MTEMGLMVKYLRVKEDLIPDGIRRPFTFFKCLHALDAEAWKTADKVALEADIPVSTARSYLRIIYNHGMAERKLVHRNGGNGKVYVYRLNESHYRFRGVEWR